MKAFLVAGLAFGDEGKGACVDKLCREYPVDLVVRYNGGSQAAHNVVTPEGDHHTFAQFGAGTLANPHVKTFLSRYMVIDPVSMMREAEELSNLAGDVWDRTTVDQRALLVTPFHKHLNQLREMARGDARHGSCGMGIGVAREMQIKHPLYVPYAGDTQNLVTLRRKLTFISDMLLDEIVKLREELGIVIHRSKDIAVLSRTMADFESWPAKIVDHFKPEECMVFEGAQGVMLDETYGTAPHNTWTNTTFENANTLLDEAKVKERTRVGCLRSYYTRHGAGPFPSEDPALDLPELHNSDSSLQGKFRVGQFDFNMARRALRIIGGVDYLAVSHLDYLPRIGESEVDFLYSMAANLRVPVAITAHGPSAIERVLYSEVVI